MNKKKAVQIIWEAINEAEQAVTKVPLNGEGPADEASIKEALRTLVANEVRLADTSGLLGDTVSSLSSFDVGMTYISEQLMNYAGQLMAVSDSNLGIVEETTATLNIVDENAKKTTEMLGELGDDAQLLSTKTEESQELLNQAKTLKDELVEDIKVMAEEMSQLMRLVDEVNEIVDKVQSIAGQTNLLALNASIEAALRANSAKDLPW